MVVDVRELSFAYHTHQVLKDACFSARSGEIVCLLGRNGAGKSTLFRCILGLLTGYSGTIAIDGRDIRRMGRKELSRLVSYIPQSSTQVFNFSVFDAVLMGRTAHLGRSALPTGEDEAVVLDVLDRLGLEGLAECGYGDLSGGEQQLVLIARALAQSCGVVVMDEPTANLDVGNRYRVMEQVRRLRAEGYLIILSTHDPQQALTYADRVLILKDGKMLADGAVEEVLREETLRSLYGIEFGLYDIVQRDGGRQRVCVPVQKMA